MFVGGLVSVFISSYLATGCIGRWAVHGSVVSGRRCACLAKVVL